MKRLAIVTGSRAEWGVLRPLAQLAVKSKVFKTSIIAAGMHLLPEYGYTCQEIEQDGFEIEERIPMDADPAYYGLAQGVRWFGEIFGHLAPDMVLVFGDRVEALAATLAAAYQYIPICHDGGGDTTATIDNAARHAISHFSSLHTVATDESRDRLIRMGIPADTVHVTGSLAIDGIRLMEWRTREETLADLGLPSGSQYLLVAFHPEPEHAGLCGGWMDNLLRACYETGLHVVVTYPNSDPGNSEIIASIKRHTLDAFPSLGRTRYLHALKYADALVGNSSSGLYEAPSLRVPVVNVGERQTGRIKAANVLDCGYTYSEIAHALQVSLGGGKVVNDANQSINPYGDGYAAERILALIEGAI